MNTKSQIAVFPGSFDPFTNGHIDIVERSLKIFDKVHIAILENMTKNTLFTSQERIDLIREIYSDKPERVVVDSFGGLLVDYVNQVDSTIIIRGLRATSDYDYEAQMALMNRQLRGEIETLFMMTREKNSYISSTLVKQVAPFGGDVSGLVHPVIENALKERYSELHK